MIIRALAFIVLLWSSAAIAQAITGRATVIDGDTIEIRGDRIRLWGIDAPESRQTCLANGRQEPAGRRAAFALADMIGERVVTCEPRSRDRYGRTVAVCSAGGSDIGGQMVRSGWARAFVRYSRDYLDEESQARDARRGMWAWSCEAPWEWRAGERNRQVKDHPTR